MSLIGFAAALAIVEARSISASLNAPSTNTAPASGTYSGVGATAANAIRAAVQRDRLSSSVTDTPAPTTAMSISLRGINRRYVEPERGFGAGKCKLTRNSPRLRAVLPGAVQNFSTGNSRVPSSPAITHTASSAINAGIVSAAGEALHKLPPTLAR